MPRKIRHSAFIIIGLVLLNILAFHFYKRWDLTDDKRYSLSDTTKNLLQKVEDELFVKVYLKGDFPLDFKRLQQETKQYLDELKAYNPKLHYRFINPKGKEEELIDKNLEPSRLTVEENGKISETIIFPWAIVSYKNKMTSVPLLIDSQNGQGEQLQRSIENLEYTFAEAIAKITTEKRKTVAILRGNGEWEDIYLYDFLSTLRKKYHLAPFYLRKPEDSPQKTLSDFKIYDMAIVAKPTRPFTETEKLILDQYIINGGKVLWLLDNVVAEMDSLRVSGEMLVTARDLNLTDLLFSYGVRINYNLVQDLYSSKIAVATGNIGNQTQFQSFLWRYFPLVRSSEKHPITKNTAAVHLEFPSGIDTLKNAVKKEILLQSSPLTRLSGVPSLVSLSSIADKVKPEMYNTKPQILGVLLEGRFTSAYEHRTRAFQTDFKVKSSSNRMLVVSDGDIIANQIQNGQPTRMDVDKWTNQYFGNKNFLLNCVDYLLGDEDLLAIRGKSLNIRLLNKEKVVKEKGIWQLANLLGPFLFLLLFGGVYQFLRRKKYS